MFGSLIYRAIGEPEYWHKNSVAALVKLLSDEYGVDGQESHAQLELGKELVSKLSEKESLVSAVMTVVDTAPYGLLIVDQNLKTMYHNKKIDNRLDYLLDTNDQSYVNEELRDLIAEQVTLFGNSPNNELIRLNYNNVDHSNIYLRSILKNQSDLSNAAYVHQIIVVSDGDNNNQICDQVAETYNLSEREVGIVQSAVKILRTGGSTKEIAEDLFISPNTVKTHLRSIYAKSGVKSVGALVSLYLQHEVQQLAYYFGAIAPVELTEGYSSDLMLTLSNGQNICYREYGVESGRPLIVLHNSYSSRLNVPPNGSDIATKVGRRVIVFDRPGYGKSPKNDRYPDDFCDLLAEFADKLGLIEFDLIANSLSVRYGLEFALRYPAKLSKLILAAPVLLTKEHSTEHCVEWLVVAMWLYKKNSDVAAKIYKLWHASASLKLDTHIEKNLQTTISSAEKGQIDKTDFINVLKDNFRESAANEGVGSAADFSYCFNETNIDLSTVKTQVDIWLGTEDGICSPEGVYAIFEDLPNKTFFEKEGFGEHIYYSLFEQIISEY